MNHSGFKKLLELTMEVRWGDLDALGHVNNTRFLRYIEEIRVQWFETLDAGWIQENSGPVVANIQCGFHRPIHWPARIKVDLAAQWKGGKSMLLAHQISDAQDPAILYGTAEVVLVWIDRSRGKAIPLPETVQRAILA